MMTALLAVVFFVPELGGWFLEKDNFAPADVLQTPPDIVPLWYLHRTTRFCAPLLSSGYPAGLSYGAYWQWGLLLLCCFFFLGWTDHRFVPFATEAGCIRPR